jgi:Ca2+/Na+ antiporter
MINAKSNLIEKNLVTGLMDLDMVLQIIINGLSIIIYISAYVIFLKYFKTHGVQYKEPTRSTFEEELNRARGSSKLEMLQLAEEEERTIKRMRILFITICVVLVYRLIIDNLPSDGV